ncbi:MAG: SusC/RagA family TonB-linked outer membrane protein [Fimbriimonadaceae bacterium]|nr:SusC/RagA family TonB-linked outer membrane protein [Chitinophagales bacterium]
MRKLAAVIFITSLCFVGLTYGQNMTISGTVSSSLDNESLPGATIVVKGTTIGTVTDIDGKYMLSVPQGSTTLEYSFVGYKAKTESINGRILINVSLDEDVLGLEELVVTAIGIQKEKKALNYSTQEVEPAQITSGKNANLVNNLNGKVAGLDVISSTGSPGGASYMTIRGNRSISGNNQPLIVIDGIPFDNSQYNSGNFNDGFGDGNSQNNNLLDGVSYSNRAIDLNPDDIASVNVLKGAAASALYGSRAANGVIIITTKKGNQNPGSGKSVNVTYSSSITFDQVSNMPGLQEQFAQGSGGEYSPPSSGASGSWGPNIDSVYWTQDFDPEDVDKDDIDQNGTIVVGPQQDGWVPFEPYDNVGTFFQTGKTFENNLSLSGGTVNDNYYFSIGHMNQEGIVPLSDFTRTSVRLSGSTALGSKWKTSAGLNYSKSGGTRAQQGSNISGVMLGLLRTPITFDNSNGSDDPTDPAAYIYADGTQRNYRGGGGYDNPYWTINQNPFVDDVNRMFGNAEIQYDPISWLNITYRAGADFYSDRRKQIFALNSRGFPAGQINDDNIFSREINSDLLVTLKKDFSEKLAGSLLLGNNLNTRYFQQTHAQGDGLVIPDYYNMQNAVGVQFQEYHSTIRTIGYFGNAEMSYAEMLYLAVSGRYDKSSTFFNGDKGFFYPSVSLGLIITEVLGIADNKILPYAKLRASYSEVGTQPGPYLTTTTYTSGFYGDGWITGVTFPYLGLAGFQQGDVLGNPDLGPENTKSLEFGADLRFLNNRIGLDFTYYDATSVDQIIGVPIAASSGYLQQTLNAAEVENKGIEVAFNATPIKRKDFSWDFLLNFSHNENIVNSLAEGIDAITLSGFEGSLIAVLPGESYGVIYGSQWVHDADGNILLADAAAVQDAFDGGVNAGYVYIVDIDGDGELDPEDIDASVGYPMFDVEQGILGDPNPDYIASLINTFTYKGLSLSFQFDQRKGGDMWNGTRGALDFFGRSEFSGDNRDQDVGFAGTYGHLNDDFTVATSGDGSDNTFLFDQNWAQGGFGSGFTGPTELFIEDASFIRLREVNISYTFASKILEKSPISSLTVGASARNLWISTDYTGVDPETSLVGAQSSQGLDYFNNPGTKSYGFNLKVSF